MEPDAVLDLFRETGALLEGHFELSSGRRSNRYFQCARVLAYPRHAETLALALEARLRERHPELELDLVVGPAMGAVVWSQEVARAFGTRSFFTERVDGAMALRRGFAVEPGERVLVVEDVLTTGGSAREVIDLLRGLGADVVAVGGIVNRSGRPNPFEDLGLPFVCLAEVEAMTWGPDEAPPAGVEVAGPAVKPGSRPGQPVA